MNHSPQESRESLYDVYYDSDGTKFIVLEGLSVEHLPERSSIQQEVHEHYDFLIGLYMIVFGVILTYMIGTYLIMPLIKNSNLRRQ